MPARRLSGAPRPAGDRSFIDALDAAGLRLGSYEKTIVDVSASVPLSTVITEANLGKQADELARFAGRNIARLFDGVPQGANPTARPPEQPPGQHPRLGAAFLRARWQ